MWNTILKFVCIFRWMDYNNFDAGSHYLAPSPSWPYSTIAQSVSTKIPLSEDQTGALTFSIWSELGEDFLVKSNINNWIACSPNGGSIAEYKHGSVKCKLVKIVVPGICEDVVSHILRIGSGRKGPALGARHYYYYFELNSMIDWPVADPCGLSETNHLQNVPDPSGWIYLRESAVTPDINVIHVRNDSHPAGTCISFQIFTF